MGNTQSKENKYLNSKIYMIGSKNTDKIYIGSTTKDLNVRLRKHENTFKNNINVKKKGFMTSFEIIKCGNYFILLLEYAPVQTKEDLEKIEGNWIRKFNDNCVNIRINKRTRKEYLKDNKEKISVKQKEYNNNHKDEIKQHKKEYYEENKIEIKQQKKEYYEQNKKEILLKTKNNYLKNKVEIDKKRCEKFDCVCGGKYTYSGKARHLKSDIHQKYENLKIKQTE